MIDKSASSSAYVDASIHGTGRAVSSAAAHIRTRLANANDAESLSSRLRARRWQLLLDAFPSFGDMAVLDLGGTVGAWRRAPVLPARVTVVNLRPDPSDLPGVETRYGDACDLPETITPASYDLVYSNSVIEHVGGYAKRVAFAANVRSCASYWVQTPYRYFPIEPHWLCPGFQFLPVAVQGQLVRRWKIGHRRAAIDDESTAIALALGVELMSRTEMRHLFPEATLECERVGPITKSLIATRAMSGQS